MGSRQAPRTTLETARLRLVASHAALAAPLLAFEQRNRERRARHAPPPTTAPPTPLQRLRRDIDAFAAGSYCGWWLQPRDDASLIIGTVELSQLQRGPFCSAMLGYAIDGGYEGCGWMSEALHAVIDEVFSPRVNLHRLQANVQPGNARSLRLLDRLGFVREGLARDYLFIDGAWRDHVLTARLNAAFVKPAGW